MQIIEMPNVKVRIDHMDVDVKGNRLFVAREWLTRSGRSSDWQMVEKLPGFKKTQGIAYVPSPNKVFVASGDDGMLRVFRGDTLGRDQAGYWSQPCRLGSSQRTSLCGIRR